MDVWVSLDSPCTHRWVHMYMCRPICVSLLQPPSSLSGRTFMSSLLSANVYLLCILGSLLCVSYWTAVVVLYSKSRPVKVPPEKCLYKYFFWHFFLFGLVWRLDGRSVVFAPFALPCVFRVCVLKGKVCQVLFLFWAGV